MSRDLFATDVRPVKECMDVNKADDAVLLQIRCCRKPKFHLARYEKT